MSGPPGKPRIGECSLTIRNVFQAFAVRFTAISTPAYSDPMAGESSPPFVWYFFDRFQNNPLPARWFRQDSRQTDRNKQF
jgi:hypothetical protein